MRSRISPLLVSTVIFMSLFLSHTSAYSAEAVNSYNDGVTFAQSHQYEKATDSFEHAIALEPAYYEAWNEKADALNRLMRYNESLQAVDRALAIKPDFVRGWINRGAILYNMGRYEEELQSYDRATAIDPESDVAWFNRAYALAGLGRWDEAVNAFDRVSELNPSYPYLEQNRGNAIRMRDEAKKGARCHCQEHSSPGFAPVRLLHGRRLDLLSFAHEKDQITFFNIFSAAGRTRSFSGCSAPQAPRSKTPPGCCIPRCLRQYRALLL